MKYSKFLILVMTLLMVACHKEKAAETTSKDGTESGLIRSVIEEDDGMFFHKDVKILKIEEGAKSGYAILKDPGTGKSDIVAAIHLFKFEQVDGAWNQENITSEFLNKDGEKTEKGVIDELTKLAADKKLVQ